ncbi:MAG: sugar phosphate isomerase/epimerase [Bacteroidota bacterium]|nr:sugar phosphate isomerase/epimerase [Bacteroidota bacterium]
MTNHLPRRKFLSSMVLMPAVASSALSLRTNTRFANRDTTNPQHLKSSLNAYSFNAALSDGSMDISGLLDFCASAGFDGVDITGYYFKGYPEMPPDDYLFAIKRKAFRLGLEISGTGVRNDFTIADKAKRALEVILVKNWIEVAAKIGAPVIRIFTGNEKNEGVPREEVTDWMLRDIQTCVEYGKERGVVVAIQNHNDFIQTASQVVNIIEAINSEWLGLILDIGSFRQLNLYEEINRAIKYAVSWQIKEKVFINGQEVVTDINKVVNIIKAFGYRGYLPIETLGEGDPKTKVTALLAKLQQAIT